MLTFVSKEALDSEKLIKEELSIKSNLIDYFATTDPKDIMEKMGLQPEKEKQSKRQQIYTKILYYFSIVSNSKDFVNNDKAKLCIHNFIKINNLKDSINIYKDMFNILDEKHKEIKKYILEEIYNSNIECKEDDFLEIYNLFVVYITTNKFDIDIINKFVEIIDKKKNYHLLKKLENNGKLRDNIKDVVTKDKEILSNNINLNKLFFFLTIINPDLVDEDLDEFTLHPKLEAEKKMFTNLSERNNDLEIFSNKDLKYYEDNYGEKGAELIYIGAKEVSLHEIFIDFADEKKNVISFKDLVNSIYENEKDENEILKKFEDIEDYLISGKEKNLFNISIDYLQKEIKILYLRRPQYKPEDKVELLNKIKNMKTKLEFVLKSLEKI